MYTAAAAVIALVWLAIASWAFRGDLSRGRRRCPRCWYDMGGGGLTCPECGHVSRRSGDLYRPRRRKKLAAAAVMLGLTAYPVHRWPDYQQHGMAGIVPASVVIAGLPWWPDSLVGVPWGQANERSLMYRYAFDDLSPGQRAWLQNRSRRLLMGNTHLAAAKRCVQFVPEMDADLGVRLRGRLAEALASGDDRAINAAAEVILTDSRLFRHEAWSELERTRSAESIRAWADAMLVAAKQATPDVSLACCALLGIVPGYADEAIVQAMHSAVNGGPLTRVRAPAILQSATYTEGSPVTLRQFYRSQAPVERRFAILGTPPHMMAGPGMAAELEALLSDADPNIASVAADHFAGINQSARNEP